MEGIKKMYSVGGTIDKPGSTTSNKTGSWRTFKPVIDKEKCRRCGICWSSCPDSCISRNNGFFEINYDYCKGCGICAKECPAKCIEMKLEQK